MAETKAKAEEAAYAVSEYAARLMAANAAMELTDIKGRPYAEVNQRVLAFWALFPEGRIETERLVDDGGRCDFVARVYRTQADERPAATGHAFEVKSGRINGTSYVENCETSAVGRALGMLGIGAKGAIASADEVRGAIAQQEAPRKPAAPKEPPESGPFVARCMSCGTRFTFGDAGQYRAYAATASCCASPHWAVE